MDKQEAIEKLQEMSKESFKLAKIHAERRALVEVRKRGEVMTQSILKLEHDSEYANGTHITIIEESEIESISYKILQIMPLASGKFLVEIIR